MNWVKPDDHVLQHNSTIIQKSLCLMETRTSDHLYKRIWHAQFYKCTYLIKDPEIVQKHHNASFLALHCSKTKHCLFPGFFQIYKIFQTPVCMLSNHFDSKGGVCILRSLCRKCPCVSMIWPAMTSSYILYLDCVPPIPSALQWLLNIPVWTSITLPLHWAISGCISPRGLQHALLFELKPVSHFCHYD